MTDAFICDAVRTPIGRYAGALSSVRADDLAAIPLRSLKERNPAIDWAALDDIIMGCANQAGEDNRNVARMAALIAGLGETAPGTTVNRLCGSGMDAVTIAARAIKAGEADLIIASGVESMSRAPFVMGKAAEAFSRSAEVFDTTIGWRFVNPLMRAQYGIDSMPETAENVAAESSVSRADSARMSRMKPPSGALQMIGESLGALLGPREYDRRRGLTTASRPEAQRRFTVSPGTSSGSRDSRTAMRATLRLSSPA